MQMIPPILNDTGDCCCQNCPQCNNCGCVPGGDGCICRGDKSGDSIESAITCDLTWKEKQPNGKYKYYKVVSGSSQQNMPVVLPTASLTKRGVVQLTNELSDRQDLALTPKGAKTIKTELDSETAERIAKDTDLQNQINEEKSDRANADTDLLNKINQEKADRTGADKTLSDCITQETADRKKADSDLSNCITSAESKADSAVSKANKAVTDVTSDGNATVTVTKADGTSKSFTINNVAHASSADSATNADHAIVADRLAGGSALGIPNYAKGTSFINIPTSTTGTFTNTADRDGFVTVYGGVGTKTSEVLVYREVEVRIKVNDTVIAIAGGNGNGSFWQGIQTSFFVKKGDVVTVILSDTGDSFNCYITSLIFPLE